MYDKKFMRSVIFLLIFSVNFLLGLKVWGEDAQKILLPRFASLRSNEVNLRTGPGVRYPVEWVFYRKALPVSIIKEYDTWRLVLDWEGTKGWVHQSTLVKKRTLIVTGKTRTLRKKPNTKSPAIAKLEDGVIAELKYCPLNISWCRIETHGFSGWLRRAEFWGVETNEVVQ